ncbi:MAG: hypothetical protein ACC642_11190 [Pseudomonadales bacterium]
MTRFTCAILALGLSTTGLFACTEAPPPAGVLRACLYDLDPPRSTAPGSGFDVDVARLVASRINHRLEIVWLKRPPRTEIESTDVDYRALLSGGCDLQLSVPGGAIADFEASLSLTDPYYGTGYELIPADADLASATLVAVRANSVAHVVVDDMGLNWTMQPNARAIVDAVASGDADAGLIWGPELALLMSAGVAVERNPQFQPSAALRWNQHMAVRRSDHSLLVGINAALSELETEIAELLIEHRLPPHRSGDLSAP